MSTQYFGTDGIRGRTGEYPIVPEFALQLGWAVGCVLLENGGQGPVLITKDTRLSGYLFESALEAGLVSAGVEVYQLGPMPTPAMAYLTRSLRAQAGIVISASHNLYQDNGFKFFSAAGTKFPPSWQKQVEEKMALKLQMVPTAQIGKAHRLPDVAGRYIEFCKSTFSRSYDLRSFKIVVDCAHGAMYHIAPVLLRELGANVIAIGDKPNGLNINDGVGATSPEALQEAVLREEAHWGIAFDGDGDRVVFVDEKGALFDGDQLLYLLASEYQDTHRLRGGVVGTFLSNLGLEQSLQERGISFVRTHVGDRHVLEALLKHDWNLGAETSGHILCLDQTTTGDGLISALQVIQAMLRTETTLGALCAPMRKMNQVLLNVRVESKKPLREILAQASVQEAQEQSEKNLLGRGRLVVRASGTEPVIRIMVEGEDRPFIQTVADYMADKISSAS